MTRETIVLILLTGLMLSSTSCQPAQDQVSNPLDGTSWQLFAYRKTKPMAGTVITAEFADGEVRGRGGCNSYGGSFTTDGSDITFEVLEWTAMACIDPPGVMEQEQTIMNFFINAERFELEGDRLFIYRSDGEALTFDRLD